MYCILMYIDVPFIFLFQVSALSEAFLKYARLREKSRQHKSMLKNVSDVNLMLSAFNKNNKSLP